MTGFLNALTGNKTAGKVLLFLQNYDRGYPGEIAKTFTIPLNMVQRQLLRLERGGILVSRIEGGPRYYYWNPRCVFVPELQKLMDKVFFTLTDDVKEEFFRQRRRPRRPGKPLWQK